MINNNIEKSREIRIGLVLYGGVSLAVYINGVAQEFFNAVRGRGVYKLLKALTDSDIVVDVISGTSAGGVNGVLLAYALCNNKEFTHCANLWREHGDIAELLRPATTKAENCPSLLRSEDYYQPCLEEAFRRMPDCGENSAEDVSQFNELDLFVTGTDVHGTTATTIDDAGNAIDVKDHRAVFVLKHRRGRKEPFNPGADRRGDETLFQALAKLSRITSCFPSAFAPVAVGVAKEDAIADERLRLWGKLSKEQAHFIDGGVLDNKPFTSTIREIFYRMPIREVERRLFYVEPDPERFRTPIQSAAPNVLQVVMRALVSIPSYETIADDLRLLAEHNNKVERFQRLLACMKPDRTALPAETQRFINSMDRWHAEGYAPSERMDCGYAQSRLLALSESAIQGVLKNDGGPILGAVERDAMQRLLQSFDRWPGSGAETLYHFDVNFRLRRLFHVLYYACPEPDVTDEPAQNARIKTRWFIGRQIKLLEIIKSAMERLFDEIEFEWVHVEADEIWRNIDAAMRLLLHAEGVLPTYYAASWQDAEPQAWLGQRDLTQVNELLKGRVAHIKLRLERNLPLDVPVGFCSALRLTDLCEQRMMRLCSRASGIGVALEAGYTNFTTLDAQTYPLELVGELREKDVIRTVRISPYDARRGFSNRNANDKVCGDRFAHFGAFFKRSWRANDILWGRLDAAGQLIETLMEAPRLEKSLARASVRNGVRRRLNTDLDPAQLFPKSGHAVHAQLRMWLEQLCADDAAVRQQALAGAATKLDLLVETAQFEILHDAQTGLGAIIGDAIRQQTVWNQYRVAKKRERLGQDVPEFEAAHNIFFGRGAGQLDPLVATVAAEEMAHRALERYAAHVPDNKASRPMETPLGVFFVTKYRVGLESIAKDLPLAVSLDILSQALLVARSCIIGAFGSAAGRVRRSIIYIAISAVLWTFRGFALLWRRMAGLQALLIVAVFVFIAYLVLRT